MREARVLFGEYVRRLRKERDLSVVKLARLLNIDTTFLSGIEKGRKNCSTFVLAGLYEHLGIDAIGAIRLLGKFKIRDGRSPLLGKPQKRRAR